MIVIFNIVLSTANSPTAGTGVYSPHHAQTDKSPDIQYLSHTIGMYSITYHPKRFFQIAISGLECISINGQWRAQNDQRCSVVRALDGLFQGESAHSLNGNGYRFDHLTQLIQGIGHPKSSGRYSSSFIVSNMVDDIITSEIFQSPGTSNHIRTAQVIPHDFHSKILPCLNHAFDGLFMCT